VDWKRFADGLGTENIFVKKESLPQKQQQILQTIGTVMSERNFYLAGGTALAIYYEHRMSVDLD